MKADTQTHFPSICYWIDDLVCKATNCVLFAHIHHFYISIKWDISIADISTLIMLISMMDISTAHISIIDTSKMIYLGYIKFKLHISFMHVSMNISIILIYPCKNRYIFYWIYPWILDISIKIYPWIYPLKDDSLCSNLYHKWNFYQNFI